MQENKSKDQTHELLMCESPSYSKLFSMGLCRIDELSPECTVFEIGSPNYLLADFSSAVEKIWPSISISYVDNKIPMEVRITGDNSLKNEVSVMDRRSSKIVEFRYNPALMKSISAAAEVVLGNIISDFDNILYCTRKKNVYDERIPQKWPLDRKLEQISNTLTRVIISLFNTHDKRSFFGDVEMFGLLILQDDIGHLSYFPKDLIDSISERYPNMRHINVHNN